MSSWWRKRGDPDFREEVRGWGWAGRARQNLRYAFRGMQQRPAFSVTAVVTLGGGIGFLTAIFTVYYALAYRALPVRDAGSLVNVYQELSGDFSRGVNGVESMVSYPEYLNYRAAIDSTSGHGGTLRSAAVFAPVDIAAETRGGSLHAEYASCNYFPVLGVQVAYGRGFTTDECAHVGDAPVVVLGHALWEREFNGDPAVVGRVVRLNQLPFTVIGVAERGFAGVGVQGAALWLPVTMQPALDHGRDSIVARDWSWMIMVARLRPGATVHAARSQLSVTARQRDEQLYPGRVTRVDVVPAARMNFPEMRERGALIAGAVSLLGALLIVMVCANLMNLLLARGIARRREIGIRLAVGASRARLVEQLLTESVLLALIGGGLGFVLAYALPPLLPKLVPVPDLQLDLRPDRLILLLSAIISLVTAVVFGLLPALHSTDVDLVSASRGAMSTGGRQRHTSRLRAAIVGAQVGGSGLLLVVSALFLRAATHAAHIDPGFTTTNVVAFRLNLDQLGYAPGRVKAAYGTLRERAEAWPGVEAVTYVSPLPLLGRRTESITPLGATGRESISDVAEALTTPTIFETLDIPIVSGRAFTEAEVAAGTAAVVSESLARMLAPSGGAVGSSFRIGDRVYVVTGIARETRYVSLGSGRTPLVYLPGLPGGDDQPRLLLRTHGSTTEIERMLPRWAREIDPAVVATAERLDDRVALALRPVRLASSVSGAVGLMATLLALVGIYGVVSYAVSQQSREIAIRQALGATRGNVIAMVLRQGARPVVTGLAVALVLALFASRAIRGLLFGVSPVDPLAYAAVATLIGLATGSAMYAPARRAMRISPATALRED